MPGPITALNDLPPNAKIVKVKSSTNVHALAQSLSQQLRNGDSVVMHAIGHGAVGQAMKAATILNTHHVNNGVVYVVLPSLVDTDDPEFGKVVTVQRLRLMPWHIGG
jgi:stage V sporulation protein SpoVS